MYWSVATGVLIIMDVSRGRWCQKACDNLGVNFQPGKNLWENTIYKVDVEHKSSTRPIPPTKLLFLYHRTLSISLSPQPPTFVPPLLLFFLIPSSGSLSLSISFPLLHFHPPLLSHFLPAGPPSPSLSVCRHHCHIGTVTPPLINLANTTGWSAQCHAHARMPKHWGQVSTIHSPQSGPVKVKVMQSIGESMRDMNSGDGMLDYAPLDGTVPLPKWLLN